MSEQKKTLSIFGYPIRDWIVLGSILAASFGGVSFFGGQAEQAITTQTETISSDLEKLIETVQQNSTLVHQNTIRIYELEMKDNNLIEHTDSLHDVTTKMIINLEGYFKGQIDAMGN